MKRITILGSTGSVGRNALDIISGHRNRFKVVALTAGKNVDLIEEQIKSFSPKVVAVADEAAAKELRRRIGGHASSLKILSAMMVSLKPRATKARNLSSLQLSELRD